MSRIRSANTKPELLVRYLLHKHGFRFRLNRRDLPGTPDIVLPKYRSVVFVHGCFWHRHEGCKFAYTPKSRPEWWAEKFEGNRFRDQRASKALRKLGWKVVVVWECESRQPDTLIRRLKIMLSSRLRQLESKS